MSFFKPDHEIHRRRFSRNLGLGLVLGGFVLLTFFLTVEKGDAGQSDEGHPRRGPCRGPRRCRRCREATEMTPQIKTARWLALIAVVMVSLSFAAVPFYRWFCQVTGFGGTTSVSDVAPDEVLEQTIRVRFDASIERDMPWSFKPVERVVEIRIGETGLAFYEATNTADYPVAGQASYNVTPDQAGGYFTKIECFCFTEQVLQPGQTVMMPVTFYVDPSIVKDREARYIPEITLSYTFHQIPLPEVEASLAPAPVTPVN